MAFAAVAAILAGETITATLAITAIGEIGLAATVVGAVTGDKTLMKIGGVMAIASGIGGLANSAMSAGEVAASEVGSAAAETAVEAAPEMATAAAEPFEANFVGSEAGVTDGIAQATDAAAQTAAPAMQAPSLAQQPEMLKASYPAPQAAPSQASFAPSNPAATASTPFDAGVATPATVNPAAAEVATPYQWHGDGPFAATPDQVARGGGYSTWNTMGQPISTSKFMEQLTGVGQWMEKNKMLTMTAGMMMRGIQEDRQADRLYSLRRDEVDIEKQKAYNASHTTPMRYNTGIVNAQRG